MNSKKTASLPVRSKRGLTLFDKTLLNVEKSQHKNTKNTNMKNNSLSRFDEMIKKITILGTYKITYIDKNISQHKNLMSGEDYTNYVCPVLDEIHRLEVAREKSLAKQLKKILSRGIGECFTTKSDLWLCIEKGLLPVPFKSEKYKTPTRYKIEEISVVDLPKNYEDE